MLTTPDSPPQVATRRGRAGDTDRWTTTTAPLTRSALQGEAAHGTLEFAGRVYLVIAVPVYNSDRTSQAGALTVALINEAHSPLAERCESLEDTLRMAHAMWAGERGTEAAFDGRTTAVAYTSQRLFEAVGVWDEVAAEAEPILDIRISDAGHDGR